MLFHVVSTILNLLAWWLRNLDKVDAEAMAEIIDRLVLTPMAALRMDPPRGSDPPGRLRQAARPMLRTSRS